VLLLLLSPASALGQAPQTCEAPSRYVAGSNAQSKVVNVRKVEGMALLAIGGREERHEVAAVTNACLAVYSIPDGRLVATAQTSGSSPNAGAFRFAVLAPGRYRLVSVESPKSHLVPIDAPLEVVRWPRGGVFKREKVYLHFRFQRSGVLSYASTTRKKPAIVQTPLHSARHNNGMHPTRDTAAFINRHWGRRAGDAGRSAASSESRR
jgi:hypothetical protein